jgi:ABC-type transport system substrate-binding protein
MTQSVQKKKIKETIQKDLEDIGIWNNIETIENNLTKMKTKNEKATALKQQISMCKEIVQVPSKDKYLFQFS